MRPGGRIDGGAMDNDRVFADLLWVGVSDGGVLCWAVSGCVGAWREAAQCRATFETLLGQMPCRAPRVISHAWPNLMQEFVSSPGPQPLFCRAMHNAARTMKRSAQKGPGPPGPAVLVVLTFDQR